MCAIMGSRHKWGHEKYHKYHAMSRLLKKIIGRYMYVQASSLKDNLVSRLVEDCGGGKHLLYSQIYLKKLDHLL